MMVDPDRSHAFRILAQKFAAGEDLPRPFDLPQEKRRIYVRDTLLEDNHQRILSDLAAAQARFDALARSPFTFFRGTPLLFYRDIVGCDLHLPHVFSVGDIHPANYGVMPNDEGAPFFGVSHFEQASFAPFTYDLRRGAAGFCLAAQARRFPKVRQRKVVRAFLDGYMEALQLFSHNDSEMSQTWRIESSPKKIRRLLHQSLRSRADFLAEMTDGGRFIAADDLFPASDLVADFQEHIDQYRLESDLFPERPDLFFQVKDVARRKDCDPTGFGQFNYLVLIEEHTSAHTDDRILEFKRVYRPALYGLVPGNEMPDSWHAKLMTTAHDVHLVDGDPYYGYAVIDDAGYMVREQSPYQRHIDWRKFKRKELTRYAQFCGQVLAQAHARSDVDTGISDRQIEPLILQSFEPVALKEELTTFAFQMAERVTADFAVYGRDHQRGAYQLDQYMG